METTTRVPEWCTCTEDHEPAIEAYRAYFAQRKAEGYDTEPSEAAVALLPA
jgi:hypothetical protein